MENFDIIKTVGEGTYGKAYLCKRKSDFKKCIIKQIVTIKLSRRERTATEQEASLLSKLQHPNVISFWESFKSADAIYIVMEFADGGDLDQYLKARRGKYLTESEITRLFIQICLAIKYIHDRRILHRDLKSQVNK
jgi:NIMA (never in mitosis gene a)-related kinase